MAHVQQQVDDVRLPLAAARAGRPRDVAGRLAGAVVIAHRLLAFRRGLARRRTRRGAATACRGHACGRPEPVGRPGGTSWPYGSHPSLHPCPAATPYHLGQPKKKDKNDKMTS
ncbi:hypothetical protein GCM10010106_36690 [Thermopolyspora flexuosa]|nr:hypothetical protein GCM10010106_36690 [Thermopolyspora flexuosa]